MISTSPNVRKAFLTCGMLIAWFGLVAQFFIGMGNRVVSTGEAVVNFISYFTILANGMTALMFTFILILPNTGPGRYSARPAVLTCLTLYMVVVGITYNFILRGIWNPVGLARLVDELLHLVMPLLVFVFWIVCVPKVLIRWLHIPIWLIFPAVYCFYSLGRGSLTGWYPYPFLDVDKLGFSDVVRNCGLMLLLFLVLSIVMVGVSKLWGPKN